MKTGKIFIFLLSLMGFLTALACGPKPQTGVLLQEFEAPPESVRETLAKEGRSDYVLLNDEGYALRLVYLCQNRVYNFLEEPEKNLILVSTQPILETPVENKLRSEDRERIWACMERSVREEHSRVEERKNQIIKERKKLEEEVQATRTERDRMAAEGERKKKIVVEQKLRVEEEIRRAEDDRRRKIEEEQRKKGEEERRIKAYKAGEKEEPPPPPPKVTESGVFLVLNPTDICEEAGELSRVRAKAKKHDILEVIGSREDNQGALWYQVLVGERLIQEKGKKYGWSPEEKSFWEKNKLLVWVYPGDLAKINTVKPLKMNGEEVQFTGKKASTPQKVSFFEVTYELKGNVTEKVFGWVNGKSGIRRTNKNREEMRHLLGVLSTKEWPLQVQTDILKGYINAGFTPEQAELSWGKPNHVNRTRTLVGVHEQWVYGANPFPDAFVYFENGLVKNWEFVKKNGK